MNSKISPIITVFVCFVLLNSSIGSTKPFNNSNFTNPSFQPRVELRNLKHVRDYLKKIDKLAVKTIKSPDGDIIDCVPSHKQPAFDHPLLKGQKPKNPPEMPKWLTSHNNTFEESFQVWTKSGESCPENTVPIRRTTEEEAVLRASFAQRLGHKPRHVRKASFDDNDHEHAIVYTDTLGAYYGVAAEIEVWGPFVENPGEFSLAQIWLLGSEKNGEITTSMEAGWHVFPSSYNNSKAPRLFIYWTGDAYGKTGCYNRDCEGFVQKSRKIAPGAAIDPLSSHYDDKRFGFTFYVHKDGSKGGSGDWWLFIGQEAVGYWPIKLFPHLGNKPVNMVQLGGEVVNSWSRGAHTKTQMGSGHFPSEGYGRASYFQHIKVYDENDHFIPADPKKLKWKTYAFADKCYSVTGVKFDKDLGYFFDYGGPGGAAPNCK